MIKAIEKLLEIIVEDDVKKRLNQFSKWHKTWVVEIGLEQTFNRNILRDYPDIRSEKNGMLLNIGTKAVSQYGIIESNINNENIEKCKMRTFVISSKNKED